jgi:hypothetical protein
MTDRQGIAFIRINTAHGREDWKREQARIREQRSFPIWRQRWEDLQYLLFAQEWPNTNGNTFIGLATLWGRWMWPPVLLLLVWALVRGWFVGRAWLLPLCGLGTVGLLALQTQGVTEARFRLPIDALLMAAAICAVYLRFGRARSPSEYSRCAAGLKQPDAVGAGAATDGAAQPHPSPPARD